MCLAFIPIRSQCEAGFSRVLICRAAPQPVASQPVLTRGLSVQDFAFVFLAFREVPAGPFLQLVWVPQVTSSVSATHTSLVSSGDLLRAHYVPLSRLLMSLPFVNPCWFFAVAVFPFMCSEMICVKTCSIILPRTEGRLNVL